MEDSTLAEVLYKNLVKATPCSVKRVLSLPLAGPVSVLRKKNKQVPNTVLSHWKNLFFETRFISFPVVANTKLVPLKVETFIKGQRWGKGQDSLLIFLPVNIFQWDPGQLDLYFPVAFLLLPLMSSFLDKLDGSDPVDLKLQSLLSWHCLPTSGQVFSTLPHDVPGVHPFLSASTAWALEFSFPPSKDPIMGLLPSAHGL